MEQAAGLSGGSGKIGEKAEFERVGARPAKSDMVRQTVLGQAEPFTLGDMAAQLPAASSQLIKKVLAEMKKAGQTRLVGRGRGARWEVIR